MNWVKFHVNFRFHIEGANTVQEDRQTGQNTQHSLLAAGKHSQQKIINKKNMSQGVSEIIPYITLFSSLPSVRHGT